MCPNWDSTQHTGPNHACHSQWKILSPSVLRDKGTMNTVTTGTFSPRELWTECTRKQLWFFLSVGARLWITQFKNSSALACKYVMMVSDCRHSSWSLQKAWDTSAHECFCTWCSCQRSCNIQECLWTCEALFIDVTIVWPSWSQIRFYHKSTNAVKISIFAHAKLKDAVSFLTRVVSPFKPLCCILHSNWHEVVCHNCNFVSWLLHTGIPKECKMNRSHCVGFFLLQRFKAWHFAHTKLRPNCHRVSDLIVEQLNEDFHSMSDIPMACNKNSWSALRNVILNVYLPGVTIQ